MCTFMAVQKLLNALLHGPSCINQNALSTVTNVDLFLKYLLVHLPQIDREFCGLYGQLLVLEASEQHRLEALYSLQCAASIIL